MRALGEASRGATMRSKLIAFTIALTLLLSANLAYADPALPLPRMPISGDQDGSETPVQFHAPGFDLLQDVQTFRVPGEGAQSIVFDFVFREGTYNNEFGYYRADDAAGRVDGMLPDEAGYLTAALNRAVVIFPSGANAFAADVTAQLNGGDILVFFLIQNSSLAQFRANNPQNQRNSFPLAFFSLDQLNPDNFDHFVGFRNQAANATEFGFEDITSGGDRDYDDIVYTIGATLQPSPSTAHRSVVFVRGFTSEGTCDGANDWMQRYLEEEQGHGLYRFLQVGQYLNFNYAGGGSYACPRDQSKPAYTANDTCDGIDKAAQELKQLIDTVPTPTVSILAHSMGGLVVAYMVASNADWAKQHVASVITFDATLKGVNGDAATIRSWGNCVGEAPSVRDLAEGSAVVQKAASAATIVPFYPLDATAPPGDILFPRANVRLDGSRPFTLFNWCGSAAFEPTCAPPTPINDWHGSLWKYRQSLFYTDAPQPYRIDKAPLVACGVAVAFDCTPLIRPDGQQGQAHTDVAATPLHITMPQRVARAQFVASFAISMSVQMQLTGPDGTTYGPAGAGPIAGYSVDATSEVYQVTDPLPGTWTIDLFGTSQAIANAEIAFNILDVAPTPQPLAPIADGGGPYTQAAGTPVLFDAGGSYDPDGTIVSYAWDFDGNGSYDAFTQSPTISHTYQKPFVGLARVQVTDNTGRSATDTMTVRIGGNSAFMVRIPMARR
jgi:pimeloyl-ACP methyl ester carboxylesterase